MNNWSVRHRWLSRTVWHKSLKQEWPCGCRRWRRLWFLLTFR
jgi:hypothetical protein